MLMYSVARIFSRVGGQMNETMSAMSMIEELRNAKNRLTADLEALSVSPEPTRNSRMNEGYLCYIEGMGGPYTRVADNNGPFATSDLALDTERFERLNDPDFNSDNTVGDLDDVLMFTAKAPDGQPFRGRYVKPIYNDAGVIVDGQIATFDSQYAEIVWFVRGSTLYRRVLPLLSNEQLQASFRALEVAAGLSDPASESLANVAYDNVKRGFGFFYFYDVSVHMGNDGYLVANTLGDLTSRENRYFYWSSPARKLHPNDSSKTIDPLQIHGGNSAWYWLRLATLQESASPNFRAGAPFGDDAYALDSLQQIAAGTYAGLARQLYGGPSMTTTDSIKNYWQGYSQRLSLTSQGGTTLPNGIITANELPISGRPFIDFWNNPNVWDGSEANNYTDSVNYETGDLSIALNDMRVNSYVVTEPKTFSQDVILQNVISFNVKIWDPNFNAYVDLGAGGNDSNGNLIEIDNPGEFRSFGRYGRVSQFNASYNNNFYSWYRVGSDGNAYQTALWSPCIYDTWSERYQRDLYQWVDEIGVGNLSGGGSLADVASDGKIDSANLQDFPPPYNARAKSLQIELRVFDPASKTIRNATFNVDLSTL